MPPRCCIVMERCKCSLFERIHRQPRELERRTILRLGTQICEALEYMHRSSPPLAHRDLKSQNVLLSADEDAKLCDFGLVNIKEVSAGTPNYMAPELFLCKPYSANVDVYAFGVRSPSLCMAEAPHGSPLCPSLHFALPFLIRKG